jgi:hypothetical protein
MIGSVSSGFRSRRRRNAIRAAVAATAIPAGSRQLPPAEPGEVRGVPARLESTLCRADCCTWIAPSSKLSRAEARARRRNSSLASGVALATCAAREPLRTCAGSVTDSNGATSDATAVLSGRIAGVWPLASVGSIATTGGDAAELSGVLRCESLLGSLAGVGLAVASSSGAVGADSTEAALAAAASAMGTAVAGVGVMREGNKVSGSTYPCGSLVVRMPK